MEKCQNHKVAVLIPCHNEVLTVGKVIDRFRTLLPDAEIFVFDNCSTDGTSEEAASHGATVRYVYMKGKGNVVRNMFLSVDADIYIMVDGDDTYLPEDMCWYIEPVLSGEADMVVGDRLSSTYFKENKRPFHNSGNVLVRRLVNMLFGVKLSDVMSGFRVFSRQFVKNMPVMSGGFEIETEITVYAIDNNYRIKEVPVPYKDRMEGSESKLNTFSDGIRVLSTLLMLVRDCRPLLFFSLISAVCAIISLIFLVPVFVEYFRTGLVARFPTLIFGCFVMLVALMLFCVGLVLDVIKNQFRRLSLMTSIRHYNSRE